MQYYHSLITQKSFEFLQKLGQEYKFILIGGWAVFLYSEALKSKDIDIIVDYDQLAKLKQDYDVFKNERLKKYEIKTGEFDIDIYLDHYSVLGVPVAEIKNNVAIKAGFTVPRLEILLLLKLFAWENRRGSAKGQKDELDIFSMIILPEFNWSKYLELVRDFKFASYHKLFIGLLKSAVRIKELELNEQKMAKIKRSILSQIES